MRAKREDGRRRLFWQDLIAAVRDRRGTVLLLTALSMSGLVIASGFAVDYGYAAYISQRLARAADTAAISAVSQDAATAVGGYGDVSALQMLGNAIFAENVKQLPLTGVSTNVAVIANSDGSYTAKATYSTTVKTFFSGVFGLESIPVAGLVQSTAKPATFVNYYILVDASQSMGIGTSQADMTALYNRVASFGYGSDGEAGCEFGCHVAQSGQQYTNEQLAHDFSPTITLRIDSAVQAIENIISTASSVVGSTKNISFALYTIQANPINHTNLQTVATLSNNYTTLLSQAATIDLGNNDGNVGYGDTDYVNELQAFNSVLPANGSGASAASPLNYVFIITDGVQDTSGNCNSPWGHCTGPMDSTQCTPLKAKATVGVIYTTYLPIVQSANPSQYQPVYAALVAPFASQIAPAVQACATSASYYFQATYGTDIVNAMQSLFDQTLPASARLTQ